MRNTFFLNSSFSYDATESRCLVSISQTHSQTSLLKFTLLNVSIPQNSTLRSLFVFPSLVHLNNSNNFKYQLSVANSPNYISTSALISRTKMFSYLWDIYTWLTQPGLHPHLQRLPVAEWQPHTICAQELPFQKSYCNDLKMLYGNYSLPFLTLITSLHSLSSPRH